MIIGQHDEDLALLNERLTGRSHDLVWIRALEEIMNPEVNETTWEGRFKRGNFWQAISFYNQMTGAVRTHLQ